MNASNTQLEQLLDDRDFVQEIFAMDNAEDVQKAFAAHNVDLSLEEISSIAEAVVVASEEGELNDDQMENINGGSLSAVVIVKIIALIATGVKFGADVMSEVNKYRKSKGKKTFW